MDWWHILRNVTTIPVLANRRLMPHKKYEKNSLLSGYRHVFPLFQHVIHLSSLQSRIHYVCCTFFLFWKKHTAREAQRTLSPDLKQRDHCNPIQGTDLFFHSATLSLNRLEGSDWMLNTLYHPSHLCIQLYSSFSDCTFHNISKPSLPVPHILLKNYVKIIVHL